MISLKQRRMKILTPLLNYNRIKIFNGIVTILKNFLTKNQLKI